MRIIDEKECLWHIYVQNVLRHSFMASVRGEWRVAWKEVDTLSWFTWSTRWESIEHLFRVHWFLSRAQRKLYRCRLLWESYQNNDHNETLYHEPRQWLTAGQKRRYDDDGDDDEEGLIHLQKQQSKQSIDSVYPFVLEGRQRQSMAWFGLLLFPVLGLQWNGHEGSGHRSFQIESQLRWQIEKFHSNSFHTLRVQQIFLSNERQDTGFSEQYNHHHKRMQYTCKMNRMFCRIRHQPASLTSL